MSAPLAHVENDAVVKVFVREDPQRRCRKCCVGALRRRVFHHFAVRTRDQPVGKRPDFGGCQHSTIRIVLSHGNPSVPAIFSYHRCARRAS